MSAKGSPLGSRAGLRDGPDTGLSHMMLLPAGLVLVQAYIRYQLVAHLCRLLIDLLLVAGICPMHYQIFVVKHKLVINFP